jgi:hypothetical protein
MAGIGKTTIVAAIIALSLLATCLALRPLIFGTQESIQAQNASAMKPEEATYGLNGVSNLAYLFSKVSHMVIQFNFTNADGSESVQYISYSVIGMDSVDGSADYRVNVTGWANSGKLWDNDTSLMSVDAQTGSIVKYQMGNESYSLEQANQFEDRLFGFITGNDWLSYVNSSSFLYSGNQAGILGGHSFLISTYQSRGPVSNFQDWTISVISVPLAAGHFYLVASSTYQVCSGGGSAAFKILEITFS